MTVLPPDIQGVSGHDSRPPDAATARAWLASGQPVELVQIVSARGSVPRPAGTRMLVSAHHAQGSIGGGHLELVALARARQRLAQADAGPLDWPLSLGPSLGQCCGGALTLRLERLHPDHLAAWPPAQPQLRLHLFGAGHVGRALVQVLAGLPWQVRWIDERPDEFPRQPLPTHIEPVCVDAVCAEVDSALPGDAFVILTHRHDLDLEITTAVLRRGDFGFCGLIGSATKRRRFEHRLRERGISADTLARLHCPVGLPGISGKEPGVIAVAVAAQLLCFQAQVCPV